MNKIEVLIAKIAIKYFNGYCIRFYLYQKNCNIIANANCDVTWKLRKKIIDEIMKLAKS